MLRFLNPFRRLATKHQVSELRLFLIHFKGQIMATQAELAETLRALKAQNDKAASEQAAALKKLQDALDAAGGTTPEVDAALAELKASIQAEDDINPDAPPANPE